MVCHVVNSQAQVQSRLPTLPQSLPKTQQDWNAVLAGLNQWGSILQQASHAPNIIPSQFQTFTPAAAAAVIAALSAANCAPSVDNTQQYYGAASLKATISAAGATLQFSGFPISIAAATRWYCSFQILAPSGCTASLTVSTSGGHSVTESFVVPAGASWQQVWGLFDLRPYADTQATWTFTFTSTSTVWLDGMQMNAIGAPIGVLPKFAGTQMVVGGLAYASNLDGVPDGTNYARTLAAYIQSGVPYSYLGAYSNTHAYKMGDEVTYNGNYYLCISAITGVAPTNATYWALLGPATLDNVANGSTYSKPLAGYIVNGVPYTNRGAYSGATAYNVGDEVTLNGTTYLCIAATTGNAPPAASYWQVVGSPTMFVCTGNCMVSDTTFSKQGGVSAWDSAIYSINGYTTAHISAKPSTPSLHCMFGFATNPSASNNYTNLNYGWYVNAGTWQIYESGSAPYTGGSVSITDLAEITYDGSTVTYWLNKISIRTVSVSGLTLYAFAPFPDPGAGFNSVLFGPTPFLSVQDTAQLGANAATTIASGSFNTSVTLGAVRNLASASIVVPSGQTWNVSVNANANISLGASPSGACNLQLDGTTVQGPAGWGSGDASSNMNCPFTYTTTLTAGTHTFTITGFNSSGGATHNYSTVTVSLLKR